jgi:hypothetical protein
MRNGKSRIAKGEGYDNQARSDLNAKLSLFVVRKEGLL